MSRSDKRESAVATQEKPSSPALQQSENSIIPQPAKASKTAKANHRILFAVTAESGVSFLERQLSYLQEQGYAVFVMSDGAPSSQALEGATHMKLTIEREISLSKDVVSLWNAIRLIRRIKPDIVNAGTPKAGLLVSIAAWLCRVPVRIYTCHGLRFETLKGWKRALMVTTERLSAACAHKVIAVSPSLKDVLHRNRICALEKVEVLHNGSCKGVKAEPFILTDERQKQSEALRQSLGISQDTPVIGFIGRLTKDKGVDILVEAFHLVKKVIPHAVLLLVGEKEQGDPISEKTVETIEHDDSIIHVGFQRELGVFYAAIDCLVLPSYREGFANVLIEAAVAGKPTIATRTTGMMDSVTDGITGLLIEPGDMHELAERMIWLIKHPEECVRLGVNGHIRALRDFDPEDVVQAHAYFYHSLHKQRVSRGKAKTDHHEQATYANSSREEGFH
ncbi:glycosyltransferase family 4 protein [Paenibacillus sp. SC116]|uniref:glycosyltransferase family 4 protein n=1 Tax=Paenibacillus sp. SC116 TaxID=2968986 RepID=UPI00215B742B|nr:glycosyltransferase family 4 protein [Paenibacillus sp. SC116]MCR8844169.1 glycosyltransferase family 4 protein [Paenibacillus sp. SC116]